MVLDLDCSNSGKPLPNEEQAHPPGGTTCPACGRGVGTTRVSGVAVYEHHRKVADTAGRRALHQDAEIARQPAALHNELEKWRVAGEEAQNALDDLGDDAQEEELAALQEANLHCYSKHEEIAWRIERLKHPENRT